MNVEAPRIDHDVYLINTYLPFYASNFYGFYYGEIICKEAYIVFC